MKEPLEGMKNKPNGSKMPSNKLRHFLTFKLLSCGLHLLGPAAEAEAAEETVEEHAGEELAENSEGAKDAKEIEKAKRKR